LGREKNVIFLLEASIQASSIGGLSMKLSEELPYFTTGFTITGVIVIVISPLASQYQQVNFPAAFIAAWIGGVFAVIWHIDPI
jgi:hypothetical protein